MGIEIDEEKFHERDGDWRRIVARNQEGYS